MTPSLVSLAVRVHEFLLRPGHMAAARSMAESCLDNPIHGNIRSLRLPANPDVTIFQPEDDEQDRGFCGPPTLTTGQIALIVAALHDVGCPHVEKVIDIPADANILIPPADPQATFPNWISSDYYRGQRWYVIRGKIGGLGEYALDWFRPLVSSFEAALTGYIESTDAALDPEPRVESACEIPMPVPPTDTLPKVEESLEEKDSTPGELKTPIDQGNGPVEPNGFRFRGKELAWGKSGLRKKLVNALWDVPNRRPRSPRGTQEVIFEVYGADEDTSESTFRGLISDTRGTFQKAALALNIKNEQGKIWLEALPE